jgi:hypothetical protein
LSSLEIARLNTDIIGGHHCSGTYGFRFSPLFSRSVPISRWTYIHSLIFGAHTRLPTRVCSQSVPSSIGQVLYSFAVTSIHSTICDPCVLASLFYLKSLDLFTHPYILTNRNSLPTWPKLCIYTLYSRPGPSSFRTKRGLRCHTSGPNWSCTHSVRDSPHVFQVTADAVSSFIGFRCAILHASILGFDEAS